MPLIEDAERLSARARLEQKLRIRAPFVLHAFLYDDPSGFVTDRACGCSAAAPGFFSCTPNENWAEIYVMNADGSGQQRLTRSPARTVNARTVNDSPVWSPSEK